MRLFSHRRRPVHVGPYPLERLARADRPPVVAAATLPRLDDAAPNLGPAAVSHAMPAYLALHQGARDGPVAPARAPVPADPRVRAENLKAAAYYLDASLVGLAPMPREAWITADPPPHTHAVVIAVEFAKEPAPGGPGEAWIRETQPARAHLRAAEVAVCIAGYIRNLGWPARAHVLGASEVDAERLLLAAGLARLDGTGLAHPYLGARFRAAVVTTTYELEVDRPLARPRLRDRWRSHGPGWFLGTGGAAPGWRRLVDGRPLRAGPYPMERIRGVAEPTTLILPAEIRRVPKRGNFFTRALKGDLGERPRRERPRFATKHPFTMAMTPLIRGMVPQQDGPVAPAIAAGLDDPRRNAEAVKALGYYLGADMVGVCEAVPYAWYSHHDDGRALEPYHQWAVVMLIDQGYETMEGASGDDWVSGAQSMRAYMRGALIAGVMAEHLRRLGYGARAQTNADSDVLQIPLILLAGLGELSRIGELVLNPFVGPRFKSVVLTTDLPLRPDRPIAFGLQDFCEKCRKCARECPCLAIPFGPKVMFNGYEIWKPDVERCTRYRVTNPRGSACGRCMKMCPWNFEGLLAHRAWLWLAIRAPWSRRWLARLDDRLGHGRRNLVKRWWFDLEWVNGVAVAPPQGTNERDLRPNLVVKVEDHKIALFPPDLLPPPGATAPVAVDRREGLRRAATAEDPAAARRRLTTRGDADAHVRGPGPA